MWRLILLALLFYLIIMVGKGLLSSGKGQRPLPDGDEKVFVQDALTGVYFPKSEAVTVTTGGETFHFSSVENRDAWLSRRGQKP
ncbi:MAG: hypothetical protein LBE49_00435 [Deltaproteobacteria bacterium]|jgi:hypothetical protein|nr:hypothetical protein [Deltaproteobacteria bacterium]